MRVLVIEDDPKISGFIADGLYQEKHVAEVVADGEVGLHRAVSDPVGFDALVLNLMLPRLDGFGVLAGLRKSGRATPVLMLSALDSVDDRVRGLRGGADDYLVKPFAFDELVARLLSLTRRAGVASGGATEPTRLSLADLQLDRLSRQVCRGGTLIELQPREFALLEYFLCNAGRSLTKAMILEHVFGWIFDPRTNVVDVLVFRLRNKIDREHPQKLIHTIRGLGYLPPRLSAPGWLAPPTPCSRMGKPRCECPPARRRRYRRRSPCAQSCPGVVRRPAPAPSVRPPLSFSPPGRNDARKKPASRA